MRVGEAGVINLEYTLLENSVEVLQRFLDVFNPIGIMGNVSFPVPRAPYLEDEWLH